MSEQAASEQNRFSLTEINAALGHLGIEVESTSLRAALEKSVEDVLNAQWETRKTAMLTAVAEVRQPEHRRQAEMDLEDASRELLGFIGENKPELSEVDARLRDAAAIVGTFEWLAGPDMAGLTNADEEINKLLAGTGIDSNLYLEHVKAAIKASIPEYESRPVQVVEEIEDFEGVVDIVAWNALRNLESDRRPALDTFWDNIIGAKLEELTAGMMEGS